MEVRLEGVPSGLGSVGRLSLCFQRGAKHSQSSKVLLAFREARYQTSVNMMRTHNLVTLFRR